MSYPSLEECQSDLLLTNADIRRLEAIVSNLEELIVDSGDENRSHLKMDLMRYRSMLDEGTQLRLKIEHMMQLHAPSHASDCALHNAPAYPVGPCDFGTDQP